MPPPAELTYLLHRALDARLARLLELCAAPAWQEDPECLHQVRIASRRVRAVLDLVEPAHYKGFRRHSARLKRLTRALGLTRELDVHAAHLDSLRTRFPEEVAAEFLLEELDRRRRKARRTMARRLEKLPLEELEQLRRLPDSVGLPGFLPAAAWECLEPGLRGVEADLAPLLEVEQPEALHALRIRIKRLRYALEILEPAFPAPPEPELQELKALQTALGLHHDLVLLEELLAVAGRGLAERGRPRLAAGTARLRAAVAEERRLAFGRFLQLGQAHREADLGRRLRTALGLEAP